MRKALLVAFIALSALPAFAFNADSTCVKCHGDQEKVKSLGYPQMYLDPAEIDKEVNMGGIDCVSCHLGDNTKMDKEEAHKGMPRPFYAAVGKNHKYQAVGREITNFDPIQPKGTDRTKLLMRKPDRRSTLVRLTDEGFELVNKCLKSHMDTEAEMISRLDGEKTAELNRLLRELENSLWL